MIDYRINSSNNLNYMRLCSKLEEETETLKNITNGLFNLNEYYFAGGCIYSIWNDLIPNDYDIFPIDLKSKNKIVGFFREHPELVNCRTDNAISIMNGKYQFILAYTGLPTDEVNKFDFKHNMFYYDFTGFNNLVDVKYLNDSKLYFNESRSRDVLNILTRIPKFIKRGFTISQYEILKIIECGTASDKIEYERDYIINKRKQNHNDY